MIARTAGVVLALLVPLFAAAAPPPATVVSLTELIAHPLDHYDQRMSITGVVHNGSFGPYLCELPSRRTHQYYYDDCINFASNDTPFGYYDSAYQYAIVNVIGYFSFTCPPPDPADKNAVRMMCIDRGSNGYISVEAFTRIGYAACEGDDCKPERNDDAHEIALSDPQAGGIADFAQEFLAAVRARDSDKLAALMLPHQRSEARYNLATKKIFDHSYGDFASMTSAAEPGRHYRLFTVAASSFKPVHHQLCFCTKGDCASHWPELTTYAFDQPWNIACTVIYRDGAKWYLVY